MMYSYIKGELVEIQPESIVVEAMRSVCPPIWLAGWAGLASR